MTAGIDARRLDFHRHSIEHSGIYGRPVGILLVVIPALCVAHDAVISEPVVRLEIVHQFLFPFRYLYSLVVIDGIVIFRFHLLFGQIQRLFLYG